MDFLFVILKGALFGITLSFVTGPAMFSLIQTSLNKGFRSGVYFAIGIFLSDVFLLTFTYLGFSSLISTPRAKAVISIIGGVILIIMGTYTFLKKKTSGEARSVNPTAKNSFVKYIAKGFLFNIVNPGVWFYWLIPIGIATTYATQKLAITFLVSMISVIFIFDLLKCMVANKLKTILTERVIIIINKVLGIILILFGVYLIVTLFWKFEIFSTLLQKNG